MSVPSAPAATVFDDFEVNEGHFDTAPTTSSSNSNIASSSTAVRVTTDHYEPTGVAAERLVINASTAGNVTRLRFLSGLGTPANNTPFTTSAGAADGFIGLAVKTTAPGWTMQLALDGPVAGDLQGGADRSITPDGQWHIYEWDLDDPGSWGTVQSIAGNPTFEDGQQTIDSIVFRHSSVPASSTLFLDFVAKSDAGSIAALAPEPGTTGLLSAVTVAAAFARRRHRRRRCSSAGIECPDVHDQAESPRTRQPLARQARRADHLRDGLVARDDRARVP